MTNQDLIERAVQEQARRSFWAYRQYLGGPKMLKGWFQRDVAKHLQQFADDLRAGKRPKLVIQAPPQHGKSRQIVEFISWLAGSDPDLRTIYASFSERLGVRANLQLQRIYDSAKYQKLFPTRINSSNVVTKAGQRLRNREIIEYVDHDGYFRNTTVRGSITGESLDLGVIDDPIKGREEAGSVTIRDKTWDWLLDDFFSRFSESAGMLTILTRWHVDDPIGRLIAKMSDVKVLSYPAIAEQNEAHRREGEPLFPEHKSLDFLMERKKVMNPANWQALYQQSPRIVGGGLFKGDWFKRYDVLPQLTYRKIYADTAQKTGERHDYSVFEVWGMRADGAGICLVDMIRGKWEAPELKRQALSFWKKHAALPIDHLGSLRQMRVEDKASGTGLIQDIRTSGGIPIYAQQRNRDKFMRAGDGAPYVESGMVWAPADAPFTSEFIGECEAFTSDDTHAHDDQIDPMLDAIDDMLAGLGGLKVWENML